MSLIQISRGLKVNLPTLNPGEPALTTDSKEIFIGTASGNIQLGDMLKSVYDTNDSGVVDNAEQLNGQAAAFYRSRTNHTGTQTASTISDFSDTAKDAAGEALTDSTSVALAYDNTGKTITATVKDDSITAAKLAADVAGDGLVQNGSTGAMDVNVDDLTVELNGDVVQVKDSGISTAKIADSAVTTAKLNDASVTAAKLAAGSVEKSALNTNVAGNGLGIDVTGLYVKVNAATLEVVGDSVAVRDGGISTAKIVDGAVSTAKIAVSAVTTGKLADDSVTAAKLAADVAGNALEQNATTGALDLNVDGATIDVVGNEVIVKDGGIGTAKLADDSVNSFKIIDDAVTTAKIVDGAVTSAKVADSAITVDKVADGALTFAKFNSSDIETDLNSSASASKFASAEATKAYVDAVATGLSVHEAVLAATTAALTSTYDNGASGVGATITNAGTQATLTLDGVTLTVGDRVLVKDQVNMNENGIYDVTVLGDGSTNWVLTRSEDYDNTPTNEVDDGDFFFVTQGNDNADSGFVQINTDPITLGVGDLEFTKFSGTGQIDAGAGLTKTGNTLNVNPDNSTVEVVGDAVTVKDGGIGTAKLADTSVTAAKINSNVAGSGLGKDASGLYVKSLTTHITHQAGFLTIADSGVTTPKIADAAVTNVKVADSAISTAKVADDAITAAKLATDTAGDGLVQNGTSGALDVNADNTTIEVVANVIGLKDAAVVADKLADSAVETAKINNAAVTTDKLADDSVTAAKLAADVAGVAVEQNATTGALDVKYDDSTIGVTNGDLVVKTGGITAGQLAANSVTAVKIATGAVGTDKLAPDAVTAAKLAADVFGNGIVENGTTGAIDVDVDGSTMEVVSNKVRIKDSGVTTAKINDGAVTAAKLADDAVTATSINSDVAGEGLVKNGTTGALDVKVDASTLEISADTVRVKDGGISASKLLADAVTTTKVADSAIIAAKLATGSVTTTKLADDSVTAAKLAADVAGAGLVQNITTGAMDVKVDDVTLEVDTDVLKVKAISAALITDFAEAAQDSIGAALSNVSTSVSLAYDDNSGLITANVNIDDDTIKKNGSNQLYVNAIDGGTF